MSKDITYNKQARREYVLSDEIEAGLVLTGSEVKSLRAGRCNMGDSFAGIRQGELWLFNLHIDAWTGAVKSKTPYIATQPRKLLLKKREINTFIGAIQRKRMTAVPLRLFFNKRGLVKCVLCLGQGRKIHDKRALVKERDWSRQKQRVLKNNAR